NLPVGLGDRLAIEQAVLAALDHHLGPPAAQPIAIDAAVDDHMRHVHPVSTVLARHALGDHAQAGLGCCELREPRLAAQAARCTAADHRAATEGNQAAGRFAADQEAREAAHPPEVLEQLRADLAEIDPLVVAGVEHHDVRSVATRARRHGAVEQGDHLLLVRRIDGESLGASASGPDGGSDLADLRRCPAGDEDMVAPAGEASGYGGADTLLGAYAHHDGCRLAHAAAPVRCDQCCDCYGPAARGLAGANRATGFSWIGQFSKAARTPSAIESHHMAS